MSEITSTMTSGGPGQPGGMDGNTGMSGAAASLLARPKQHDLWYREPWLLLVLGGPLLVIVACVITTWLAMTHPDPLVNKDYYRDGLRINQTMAAEEAARKLVLSRPAVVADDQGGKTHPEGRQK